MFVIWLGLSSNVAVEKSRPKKFKLQRLEQLMTKTSPEQKQNLDKQAARLVYATSSPFTFVENAEFKKYSQLLRPGLFW